VKLYNVSENSCLRIRNKGVDEVLHEDVVKSKFKGNESNIRSAIERSTYVESLESGPLSFKVRRLLLFGSQLFIVYFIESVKAIPVLISVIDGLHPHFDQVEWVVEGKANELSQSSFHE